MSRGLIVFVMLEILVILFLLTACNSKYHYIHHADGGCELKIDSGRDMEAGQLRISSDCDLLGSADSLKTNEKKLDVINGLINKIP